MCIRDRQWPVENGKVLKVNYLGTNIENYDSMLVLIHFKGHPMGGYGGALKQLSIGCASSAGKTYIHTGGKVTDQNTVVVFNILTQIVDLEHLAVLNRPLHIGALGIHNIDIKQDVYKRQGISGLRSRSFPAMRTTPSTNSSCRMTASA